ncbi:DUF1073 domain-containing protein [Novacetimonas hansenii]|uniref:Anti-CBASS protein Acb1-like N-terminal domain-containing protein n=3 Tax=Novacetimonas hansenii TaxID=436 RepID=A0ABQ0SI79_NOVHA|nr:DUF1073 domain-containing protein [Novacetimonas hansenii]EFG83011.1 hypothetical protein GXY_14987 [Novacetimonas hansenii ATCC 23769]QOF95652.1 DUF1073 domain-containing protein [Novacetimonas hansenii]WEQ58538.1 DUF1073 domain-containing protein [Novacetimonas hansenii]CUW48301.1 hypothetical protein ATCC53582_02438 [Novacetimonas hansenii]GAN82565.1 hypothetical protein Gaha_0023_007 [Novacetimonas hansenii JCM 7643]
MKHWFHRAPTPPRVRREPRVVPRPDAMPRFGRMASALPSGARDGLRPYVPPPGVRGAGALAMDRALSGVHDWAGMGLGDGDGAFGDALGFVGYPLLAQMMQRAEFRKPVEVIAREATREWVRITTPETDTPDDALVARMAQLRAEMRRLRVREVLRRQVIHALGFGLGHVWPDMGQALSSAGQGTPLVIGPNGIARGAIRRFLNVEPLWTTPDSYNADMPLRPDYFCPRAWWVQGTLVDASRLFSMVPFEVSDIFKPAFNFGGPSLTQMLRTYVHNFLRTRQSVSDLVSNFATKVLKTDMAGAMGDGDGTGPAQVDTDSLTGRVEAMNAYQSNHGTFVIDRTHEDFDIVATPLSGLSELQAQSQEFMASIPGIPLVKLFGIQPAGLNASSDGEIRVFYDEITAFQEAHVAPVLDRMFRMVQLHLWGEVDPRLDFAFVPLWQMDDAQRADIDHARARIDALRAAAGVAPTKGHS